MNVIGPNIKHIRETLNWTQDQLAAKCNLLGWDLSRSTLAKIECKSRKVADYEVLLLAQALEVPESELFNDLTLDFLEL